MAVQFADEALDAWLTNQIKEAYRLWDHGRDLCDLGRATAFEDTQKQLHEFWGVPMIPKGETNADV